MFDYCWGELIVWLERNIISFFKLTRSAHSSAVKGKPHSHSTTLLAAVDEEEWRDDV